MNSFHVHRAHALLENAVQIHDPAAVNTAVSRIAAALNARYGQSDSPVYPLVLGVMSGAVVFIGQLLTQLKFPLEFDYVHITRYGAEDQGGKVIWKIVPGSNVKNRVVIVLDDILDEGETLAQVKQRLLAMGAAEVIVAVFADKAIGKVKPVRADYVGVTLPNQFVVGFGMDAYGYWRNLPGIWALHPASMKE